MSNKQEATFHGPPDSLREKGVRAATQGEQGVLGQTTTRELLEELRLRGDLAMTAMPTTDRGADGAILSALAMAVLRATTTETLDSVRGS